MEASPGVWEAAVGEPPNPEGGERAEGSYRRGGCRAVVLACIGYRFVGPLHHRFPRREGLAGAADLLTWPGGALAPSTGDRDGLLDAIRVTWALHRPDLHRPEEATLTAHHGCGRIGRSRNFSGPESETSVLEAAPAMPAEAVREALPALRIRLVRFGERETVEVGAGRAARRSG